MKAWKVWIRFADGRESLSDNCVFSDTDLTALKLGLSYIGATVVRVEH